MQTPYYLLDETLLVKNLEKIAYLRERSGAKSLLALKAFATWSVFDLMARYMDGSTSSSLNEVKLGRHKFGGETHAYSVAYADHEIDEVVANADKIIFNTLGQLDRFDNKSAHLPRGLRVNPQISYSHYAISDPARPFSRLGETDFGKIEAQIDRVSGFLFHFNCENGDFPRFSEMLGEIEDRFGSLLHKLDWVSLGGGNHFTGEAYPLDAFADRLKGFSERFGIQVYLEPGEASVTGSTTLEVTVLDLFENGKQIAVVDSSIEAHMLDLLTYQESAKVFPNEGEHAYMICGKSCLAGDIFGEFRFAEPLKVGDRISFQDTAGYTMVKKNWFNGVDMPAIAVKRLDGQVELVKRFGYDDYIASLS